MKANHLPTISLFISLALVLAIFAPAQAAPAAAANPAKGLAMATNHPEDLAALGVSWWYVWGWCDAPECVPMVRSMDMPPSCPPALLVGNEPNAIEPYGAPTTPTDAVSRVIAIEAACPATLLVAGNVSTDDWSSIGGWGSGYQWLRLFLLEYRAQTGHAYSQALGVHCYSRDSADYCLKGLAQLRRLYKGQMWVTEFGILSGNATQFSKLLDYVAGKFDRYAAYTNRQPHQGNGWEIATGVELVNGDGSLSPTGQVYSQK